LETHLKHANITGYAEREARDVWAPLKQLTNDKCLKSCDRGDGGVVLVAFDASAEVRFALVSLILHNAVAAAPFEHRVHCAAFGRSSSWLFEASSYKATPKGPPSSLVQDDARAPS
jgi:hypothetical protein